MRQHEMEDDGNTGETTPEYVESVLDSYTLEQMAELRDMISALGNDYYPGGIRYWFTNPVKSLDNQRPIDIIAVGELQSQDRLRKTVSDVAEGRYWLSATQMKESIN